VNLKENLKETLPSHNQVYALKSIPKNKNLYLKGQRQPSWPSTLIYHHIIFYIGYLIAYPNK